MSDWLISTSLQVKIKSSLRGLQSWHHLLCVLPSPPPHFHLSCSFSLCIPDQPPEPFFWYSNRLSSFFLPQGRELISSSLKILLADACMVLSFCLCKPYLNNTSSNSFSMSPYITAPLPCLLFLIASLYYSSHIYCLHLLTRMWVPEF